MKIQRSLVGCIANGVVLCGKDRFDDAMRALDIAFSWEDSDRKILLLVKVSTSRVT